MLRRLPTQITKVSAERIWVASCRGNPSASSAARSNNSPSPSISTNAYIKTRRGLEDTDYGPTSWIKSAYPCFIAYSKTSSGWCGIAALDLIDQRIKSFWFGDVLHGCIALLQRRIKLVLLNCLRQSINSTNFRFGCRWGYKYWNSSSRTAAGSTSCTTSPSPDTMSGAAKPAESISIFLRWTLKRTLLFDRKVRSESAAQTVINAQLAHHLSRFYSGLSHLSDTFGWGSIAYIRYLVQDDDRGWRKAAFSPVQALRILINRATTWADKNELESVNAGTYLPFPTVLVDTIAFEVVSKVSAPSDLDARSVSTNFLI